MATVVQTTGKDLTGKYVNELQSIMTIDKFDGVAFSGTYQTAVSGNGSSLTTTVSGTYNAVPSKNEGTIGFIANWKYVGTDNKPVFSTTSWNGVSRSDGSIRAQWLLTRYGPKSEDWDSTNIGLDTFTKM